jgi:hypothetical protein
MIIKNKATKIIMDKLVTVLRVSYPHELWIIRGKLESEGIQCFTKDELTVQAYSLYSNAIGGVKLQVFEKDENKALEILTELGYLKEEIFEPDLLFQIDQKTSDILFLKRMPVISRIIFLVISISLAIGTSLYFIIKPSTYESLTTNTWCVNKIYFKNNLIGPKTIQQISFIDMNGNNLSCETIDFRKNKAIFLPGIKSNLISGYWIFNDDETITINADTMKTIYNGTYNIDLSNKSLILKSATTTIYAYQ